MKIKRFIALMFTMILTAGFMISLLQYPIFAGENGRTENPKHLVSGDFEYYMNEDETVTIYSYKGTDTAVQIPKTIDGHIVSAIGRYAFAFFKSLSSIEIPESVISIGDAAFAASTSLVNIYVSPDNPCFVYQGNALYNKETKELVCVPCGLDLTDFVIPEGITGIKCGAFWACFSLETVTIPDSVTSIANEAFAWCTSLRSIKIPDSVTSINYKTFFACSSLTNIEIPDSVTSFGDNVFYECSSLKSIKIPDNVTDIDRNAFSNCDNLTVIVNPGSCTEETCISNNIKYSYPDNWDWLEN